MADYIPTQQEVDDELHECARYGELDVLHEFKASDDTNMINYNCVDAGGNTALHKAAANNHVDVLKFLVENNAQYILNENKVGPITWAVLNRHYDATKYLLETFNDDIDVAAQPLSGLSVLSTALSVDHAEIVNLLLEHKSAAKNCPNGEDVSEDSDSESDNNVESKGENDEDLPKTSDSNTSENTTNDDEATEQITKDTENLSL